MWVFSNGVLALLDKQNLDEGETLAFVDPKFMCALPCPVGASWTAWTALGTGTAGCR